MNLTGGPLGINPIDPFVILGVGFGATSGVAAVYFAMALTIVGIIVARDLERSRMGRAWGAIREDETAAEMMGVNTVRTKLLAFALGASFAGVAGAFQASYLGATTSDFFQFSTSILVLIMVILGGIGNIWGVLAGAIVLVYIDKTLLIWLGQRIRQHHPEFPNPSQFNFLIFGILLVVMMRFRPEGFIPESPARRGAAASMACRRAEADLGGGGRDRQHLGRRRTGQTEIGPDWRHAEVPSEMGGRDDRQQRWTSG